jgi:hypothetical protein
MKMEFSMTVATGNRVSRKTHAPLTLPGMLSTAGHCAAFGTFKRSVMRPLPDETSSTTSKSVEEVMEQVDVTREPLRRSLNL